VRKRYRIYIRHMNKKRMYHPLLKDSSDETVVYIDDLWVVRNKEEHISVVPMTSEHKHALCYICTGLCGVVVIILLQFVFQP